MSINNTDSHSDSMTASGKEWVLNESDREIVNLYRSTYNISMISATILATRNINPLNLTFGHFDTSDSIKLFLNPSLFNIMNADIHLPDIEKGCEMLADAIKNCKKIGLFGDYDVDGMSSCALMLDFLRKYNMEPEVWIPSRDDGYGLSKKAIDHFISQGVQLMFIFDCGSQDVKLVKYAVDSGLEVILIDHHKISEESAKPHVFINPFRVDTECAGCHDYRQLCATGLCFMFLTAYMKRHTNNKDVFNIMREYTVYTALATVCDVMSLKNILNRAMIHTGLTELVQRKHVGLNALMDMLKMPKVIHANHLGFTIGPRLNAGARMHHEDLSFKLLTTKSHIEAVQLAYKLDELNQQRRDIEDGLIQIATQQAAAQADKHVLFVHGDDWHVGVIGIISSIIKDLYHKPVIVVSFKETEDGMIGKGSARSVDGIDIGQILHRSVAKGLLINGGGHALAAGLSIKKEHVEEFVNYANEEVAIAYKKTMSAKIHHIDAITTLDWFMNTKDIGQLSPFGCDFIAPKIAITNVHINRMQTYKTHTLIYVNQGRITASFFAFRTNSSKLGTLLENSIGHTVDLLLSISDNGQGHVVDIRKHV